MQALFIHRHRTADQSPKEVLRGDVEQLSLEMQREFVHVALQLIASRPTFREAEVIAYDANSVTMRKRMISH